MFKTTWLGGEGGKTNKFAVSALQKQILIFGRLVFTQRIQLLTRVGMIAYLTSSSKRLQFGTGTTFDVCVGPAIGSQFMARASVLGVMAVSAPTDVFLSQI